MNTLQKNILATIPIEYVTRSGYFCTLTLQGLSGNVAQTDALHLLGHILSSLDQSVAFGIVQIRYSTDCSVDLIVPISQITSIKNTLHNIQICLQSEYNSVEPNMRLHFTIDDSEEEVELVLSGDSQRRVLAMMNLLPDNASAKHICLEDESLSITLQVNSQKDTHASFIIEKIKQLTDLVHGTLDFQK